jgi:hypothetical protein
VNVQPQMICGAMELNCSRLQLRRKPRRIITPANSRERGFPDTQILARVGITQKTEHPSIEATNLLCGASWKNDRASPDRPGVASAFINDLG